MAGTLETNFLHEIARLAFGALGMALTALISIHGPRLLRALEARIGSSIPDPIVAQAERLARDAIAFAEERGRAWAKRGGRKLLAGEKLNLAAKYFGDQAGDPVLALVRGQVADWIEATLGRLRGVAQHGDFLDVPGVVVDVYPVPPSPGAGLSSSVLSAR